MCIRDRCSEESQDTVKRAVSRLARGGSPENLEADLITKSGQRVPVAWALSGMQGAGGGVAAIVGVGRDLTLRRQLETQLIQSAKMASLGVMAGEALDKICATPRTRSAAAPSDA